MEFTIFTLLLFSNLGHCQSFNVQNISKIICSLSRSSHADIFNDKLVDSIKLSKYLFQQCNIRVRIVFDVRGNNMHDFILFASHQQDTKASLILVWSASTHLTEYSLASFFILTLVLARTQVASTKRVTGGASFKLSK